MVSAIPSTVRFSKERTEGRRDCFIRLKEAYQAERGIRCIFVALTIARTSDLTIPRTRFLVQILVFTDCASAAAALRSNSFFVVQIRLDFRTVSARTRRARFFRKGAAFRICAAAFWPSHDVQISAANRYQRDQSHERLANASCLGAKKTNINRQHG